MHELETLKSPQLLLSVLPSGSPGSPRHRNTGSISEPTLELDGPYPARGPQDGLPRLGYGVVEARRHEEASPLFRGVGGHDLAIRDALRARISLPKIALTGGSLVGIRGSFSAAALIGLQDFGRAPCNLRWAKA
jgi:hypothetical protein